MGGSIVIVATVRRVVGVIIGAVMIAHGIFMGDYSLLKPAPPPSCRRDHHLPHYVSIRLESGP